MRPHVEESMTRYPVTVTPGMSVLNARRMLQRYGIRHLPVVDGNELVGMVSDRDLCIGDPWAAVSVSGLQSGLMSGRYRSVATVMSSPVRVARVGDSVAFAAGQMTRWRISALPVLDRGKLVGIITATDCLAILAAARLDRRDEGSVFDLPGYDPDIGKMTPMPPGDERPGRPSIPPVSVGVAAVAPHRATDGAAQPHAPHGSGRSGRALTRPTIDLDVSDPVAVAMITR